MVCSVCSVLALERSPDRRTPAQIVEELPDLEVEEIREALVYAAALEN